MKIIYLVLSILWACFLFMATCTAYPDLFISNHEVVFHFTSSPDMNSLLITNDIQLTDAYWIHYKAGHFLGFFFLACLLMGAFKKPQTAIIIAIFYALLTEVLQLFFNRDGRLVDMGIDTCGILLAYLITRLLSFSSVNNNYRS